MVHLLRLLELSITLHLQLPQKLWRLPFQVLLGNLVRKVKLLDRLLAWERWLVFLSRPKTINDILDSFLLVVEVRIELRELLFARGCRQVLAHLCDHFLDLHALVFAARDLTVGS